MTTAARYGGTVDFVAFPQLASSQNESGDARSAVVGPATGAAGVSRRSLPAPRLNLGLSKAFQLHATRLEISDASFEQWEACGQRLRQIRGAVQWWLGDWFNYGEARYGEKYSQALEATPYDEQTLTNFASVARRVEFSRRREDLSWSHHEAVAACDPGEQDRLLAAAASGGWSVRELREAVRAKASPSASDGDREVQVRLSAALGGAAISVRRGRGGSGVIGITFETESDFARICDWIVRKAN